MDAPTSPVPPESPVEKKRRHVAARRNADLKKISLRWLAGFIDGEGSFIIERFRRASTRDWGYRLGVSITNTDHYTLDLIQRKWGGRVNVHSRGTARTRPCWKWRMYGDDAYDLALAVYRHLILKRRPAVVLVKFWRYRKKFPYQPNAIALANYYAKSRKLNRRGPRPGQNSGINASRVAIPDRI